MVWYGFFGTIICFIGSIISTFIPCINSDSFEAINYICKVNSNNEKNTLYFDHFLFFLKVFGKVIKLGLIYYIFLLYYLKYL